LSRRGLVGKTGRIRGSPARKYLALDLLQLPLQPLDPLFRAGRRLALR
jgi:hypothetical protein